jgi:hypothetical protein
MCEAMSFVTAPALTSFPIPLPGHAVSLAMTVRFLAPRLTSASMRRCGEPTPMKPPINSVAPSGINAAPASALIARLLMIEMAAGAPAERLGRSRRRLRRRIVVAEKVDGLPEIFAWRHRGGDGGGSGIGGGRGAGGRVGGDLLFERLEIGGRGGRRSRRRRRGRGGHRQLVGG